MLNKLLIIVYYLIISKLPNSRYCYFFNHIRMFYVSKILKIMSYDKESRFQENVYIGNGKNLSIGKHCQINENVFIQGASIGDYVMLAADVKIINLKHRFSSKAIPMIKQGREKYVNPVIEDDVWVGRGVIILPGVRISKGCIIGAGSVVTKDTEEYSIYGGIPARLIRKR